MGLAHVAALAAAGALQRLKVDAFDVDGRATTSFRHLLALVAPLLDQDPALTRAIQVQNPDAAWVAEVLAEEVEAIRAAVHVEGVHLQTLERARGRERRDVRKAHRARGPRVVLGDGHPADPEALSGEEACETRGGGRVAGVEDEEI